jgi:hypothetical protein
MHCAASNLTALRLGQMMASKAMLSKVVQREWQCEGQVHAFKLILALAALPFFVDALAHTF